MTDEKPCRHLALVEENAEWPEPVYWDHYCNCLDDAKRREILAKAREWSGKGSHCYLADHQHLINTLSNALAHATRVIEKHHRFLDERMLLAKGDDQLCEAYTWAHGNLAELMREES